MWVSAIAKRSSLQPDLVESRHDVSTEVWLAGLDEKR